MLEQIWIGLTRFRQRWKVSSLKVMFVSNSKTVSNWSKHLHITIIHKDKIDTVIPSAFRWHVSNGPINAYLIPMPSDITLSRSVTLITSSCHNTAVHVLMWSAVYLYIGLTAGQVSDVDDVDSLTQCKQEALLTLRGQRGHCGNIKGEPQIFGSFPSPKLRLLFLWVWFFGWSWQTQVVHQI